LVVQTAQDERYTMVAEWYDDQAALIRRYQFLFYPKDNSIEMVRVLFVSKQFQVVWLIGYP